MKQAIRRFFACIALCVLLTGLTVRTSSATIFYTAFSVLVTESDGRTDIPGATVKVGNTTKTTNANGVVIFNLYFDNGSQTMTVSKSGYNSNSTSVGRENEGETIKVLLAKK